MVTYAEEWEKKKTRILQEADERAKKHGDNAVQSGAYSFWAGYFAQSADSERAQRRKLERDPKALIAAFVKWNPPPQAVADLLIELRHYLQFSRPELADAASYLADAAHLATVVADEETEAAEEEQEQLQRQFDEGRITRAQMERAHYGDMP